MKIYFETILLI